MAIPYCVELGSTAKYTGNSSGSQNAKARLGCGNPRTGNITSILSNPRGRNVDEAESVKGLREDGIMQAKDFRIDVESEATGTTGRSF